MEGKNTDLQWGLSEEGRHDERQESLSVEVGIPNDPSIFWAPSLSLLGGAGNGSCILGAVCPHHTPWG